MSTKLATREDEITRVALSISQTGFVFAKDISFQPRKGTLVHNLWHGKKLTLRQQQAWRHFTEDLHNAHGKSGPVTSGYGESSGARNGSDFKVPRAFVNSEYRRLERLLRSMNRDELALLRDLIADELRPTGAVSAEIIGAIKVGYRSDDQARAAGVATVVCLLDAIAGFYEV